MKKVALIFCITVFCSELFSQKLVFEKYSYDFGNIKEVDGVVGYEFSFTNKNTKAYIDKIISHSTRHSVRTSERSIRLVYTS